MEDQIPVRIEKFGGLYERGAVDSVPLDHFIETLNVKFVDDEVWTRDGSIQVVNKANVVRTAIYRRIGEAARYILLTSDGKLYDSSNLTTPILDIAAMTDFSCSPFYNRLYITPHNGTRGLAGEFVYVYDGSTCRKAAGGAPAGTLVAETNSSSGNIEAGTHLFAVAFETASGFITKPGPAVYEEYLAPGGKQCKLTGIPVGGSEVVARHILVTMAIEEYDSDQSAYELFFLPDGRIPDNSTTELDNISFFDSGLVESADYLKDNLTEIPAGLGVGSFRGRMLVWAEDTYGSYVRASTPGEPESFSGAEGYIPVDVTEAGDVRCCFEFRDSLYITKSLRTYQTQDNNDVPATWQITTIDKGAGAEVFGVAMILDAKGANTDSALIADRSGLLLFNGVYVRPELSWKIEKVWKRINPNEFHQVQIVNDPIGHELFILVPLDGATSPNYVLYANYAWGLSPDKIRWSVFSFTPTATSLVLSINYTTSRVNLNYGSASGIYEMRSGLINDDSVAIANPHIKTAYVDFGNDGGVNHYQAARYHVEGSGTLNTTIYDMGEHSHVLAPITMETLPHGEITIRSNVVSERATLYISTANIDEWFHMMRIIVYGQPCWEMRPM